MAERPIWHRQPGEGTKAYAAFCIYRDMGIDRSIRKAAQQHLTATKGQPNRNRQQRRYCTHPDPTKYLKHVAQRWREWSMRWKWVSRCQAYDDHLNDLAESRRLESQLRIRQAEIEENERQARARLGTLRLGRAVVTRIVQRMAEEIDRKALDRVPLTEILPHLARLSSLLETCLKHERLELGEVTERTEEVVSERELRVRQVANVIAEELLAEREADAGRGAG